MLTGATPTVEYLGQVARTAEQLGFTGVLTPTGTWCEDAWLCTAALIRETTSAQVPGRVPPGSGDARRWPPDGGDVPAPLGRPAAAQRRDGWRRCGSSSDSATGSATTSATTGPTSFSPSSGGPGAARRSTSKVTTTGSRVRRRAARRIRCPTSTSAVRLRPPKPVAARHADVYLAWGEPPDMVRPRLERDARARRHREGRPLRFGIRLHVITATTVRRTRGPRPIACSTRCRRTRWRPHSGSWPRASRSARRACASCTVEAVDGLVIAPNLWAGVGLVRGGAGTAIVGEPRRSRRTDRGVSRARLRRVHPLGPPARRGSLLVRRARHPAARPGRAGGHRVDHDSDVPDLAHHVRGALKQRVVNRCTRCSRSAASSASSSPSSRAQDRLRCARRPRAPGSPGPSETLESFTGLPGTSTSADDAVGPRHLDEHVPRRDVRVGDHVGRRVARAGGDPDRRELVRGLELRVLRRPRVDRRADHRLEVRAPSPARVANRGSSFHSG